MNCRFGCALGRFSWQGYKRRLFSSHRWNMGNGCPERMALTSRQIDVFGDGWLCAGSPESLKKNNA
jgi:hypothetical protein